METELNKTPVKAEFEYDSESPIGNFSDSLEKSDSPSYVKWDFVVPAFSDEIKNAALKVKSDYHRKKRFKPRSLRRRCQDTSKFTPTKDNSGSLFNRPFYTSIRKYSSNNNIYRMSRFDYEFDLDDEEDLENLLFLITEQMTRESDCEPDSDVDDVQRSIDEVDESLSDNMIGSTLKLLEASSSQMVLDNKCDKTEIINYNDTGDVDLFNDSVNDLFSQCSQTVEDKFYKQPKKKLFSKEQLKHEENLPGSIDELINEKDDELFLKIDLNNLNNNL